jgi:hypothetical protein
MPWQVPALESSLFMRGASPSLQAVFLAALTFLNRGNAYLHQWYPLAYLTAT